MNDEQLEKTLRSMGMRCFVRYYRLFSDNRVSRADLIEILVTDNGYTETACRTRVTNGKRIIRAGRGSDALRRIVRSERVEDDIRDQARKLI